MFSKYNVRLSLKHMMSRHLMPERADRGQVWASPSVSSGMAAWRSSSPSVIHRKSSTSASVSPFVMSKSAFCALTEDWNRLSLLSLWGSAVVPALRWPHTCRSKRGSHSLEDVFKSLSDPFYTTLETCAMHHIDLSIKMADTLTLIRRKVDLFPFFDCLFFAGFTLLQPCRERESVHESLGWPYAGWLQCFTICSWLSWCVCLGRAELHDGVDLLGFKYVLIIFAYRSYRIFWKVEIKHVAVKHVKNECFK